MVEDNTDRKGGYVGCETKKETKKVSMAEPNAAVRE